MSNRTSLRFGYRDDADLRSRDSPRIYQASSGDDPCERSISMLSCERNGFASRHDERSGHGTSLKKFSGDQAMGIEQDGVGRISEITYRDAYPRNVLESAVPNQLRNSVHLWVDDIKQQPVDATLRLSA